MNTEKAKELRGLLKGAMSFFRLHDPFCDIGIKRYISPALALLKDEPCKTCGESGEIFIEKKGEQYYSDPLGKGKPCPACKPEPPILQISMQSRPDPEDARSYKPERLTCSKCGKTFPLFMDKEHKGHESNCQAHLPKPEPSGELVKELNKAIDEVVIAYATNCLEIVEEYTSKLIKKSREAAARIAQVEREKAHLEELLGDSKIELQVKKDGSVTDYAGWAACNYRIVQKLKAENKQQAAKIASLTPKPPICANCGEPKKNGGILWLNHMGCKKLKGE